MKFQTHVQVFDRGYDSEADAERARIAVQEYLGSLPHEAAEWFENYLNRECRNEDDPDYNPDAADQLQARKWREVEAEAHLRARKEATRGWLNPSGATVMVEITPAGA